MHRGNTEPFYFEPALCEAKVAAYLCCSFYCPEVSAGRVPYTPFLLDCSTEKIFWE